MIPPRSPGPPRGSFYKREALAGHEQFGVVAVIPPPFRIPLDRPIDSRPRLRTSRGRSISATKGGTLARRLDLVLSPGLADATLLTPGSPPFGPGVLFDQRKALLERFHIITMYQGPALPVPANRGPGPFLIAVKGAGVVLV
jgi:hypothetical protein